MTRVATLCAAITLVLAVLTAVFVAAVLALCAGGDTRCFGLGVLGAPVVFADMFVGPVVTAVGLLLALLALRTDGAHRRAMRRAAVVNGLGVLGCVGLWGFLLFVVAKVHLPR